MERCHQVAGQALRKLENILIMMRFQPKEDLNSLSLALGRNMYPHLMSALLLDIKRV